MLLAVKAITGRINSMRSHRDGEGNIVPESLGVDVEIAPKTEIKISRKKNASLTEIKEEIEEDKYPQEAVESWIRSGAVKSVVAHKGNQYFDEETGEIVGDTFTQVEEKRESAAVDLDEISA